MKKIFVFTSIFMLLAAGSVFAAIIDVGTQPGGQQLEGAKPAGATTGWQPISRMSTKVVVTVQYNPNGYILSTYHLTGNKAYSSGHDSTAIFFKNVGDNATLETPTTSVSADYLTTGNGWNKM